MHLKVVNSVLHESHLIEGHSHSLRKDRHAASPLGGFPLLLSVHLRHVFLLLTEETWQLTVPGSTEHGGTPVSLSL